MPTITKILQYKGFMQIENISYHLRILNAFSFRHLLTQGLFLPFNQESQHEPTNAHLFFYDKTDLFYLFVERLIYADRLNKT